MQQNSFAKRLIQWQLDHGRHDLPWQKTQDPYRIWLSEVMLQQTQVTTVIEYYARFLKKFPTVADLASAQLDDVLSLWGGLGYYSRARNLFQCAQLVMQEYGGVFPHAASQLQKLPGIGPSTAAAIAAFCYGERISILDGNVKRVLSRVFAYANESTSTSGARELWALAQQCLPTKLYIRNHPQAMSCYTQGLMDLGAVVCLPRKAQCDICPMQTICKGHLQGRALDYPVKKQKIKRSKRSDYLLWLVSPLGVWLAPRPKQGIWGGLYSFPVLDTRQALDAIVDGLDVVQMDVFPAFKHVLTHLDWMLEPCQVRISAKAAAALPPAFLAWGGQWFTADEWKKLGLPAPVRKLLQMAEEHG